MTKYNKNSIYYKRMCERVGQDFEKWLRTKYWEEEKPTREISELIYGVRTNSPNVLGWMKKLGIPTRERSHAVALQWKDNPTRVEEHTQRMKRMWAKDTDNSLRNKIIKVMQTEEYRRKQSESKMGERNGMWNPNLTSEEREKQREHSRRYPLYDFFRQQVYERDDYTCKVCNDDTGGNLVVHHLNGFHWDKENRTNVDNAVTLCEPCHREFHSIYGKKHNDLFQFSQYKQMKQTIK